VVFNLACSAGVFGARECTFSYKAAILDSVTLEDWGEEIFAEGVRFKWRKWVRGEGEGKKKTRLPAWLVRLQNPYTRWTGALIGAVGCNLIDACQSNVVFLPVKSLTFLHRSDLFLSELAMSRGLRPGISSLNGSDLLAVLPMDFGRVWVFVEGRGSRVLCRGSRVPCRGY